MNRALRPILGTLIFVGAWVIAYWAHLPWIQLGLSTINGDFAPYPMSADRMRLGQWSVFPFDLHYAGMAMTWFRAFWVELSTLVFGVGSGESAHYVFSFSVVPAFLALAFGFAAWGWTRKGGVTAAVGVVLGALAGVGLMTRNLHNDTYTGYLVLTSVLLGWRGILAETGRMPWQLPRAQLLAFAALSGLALYVSRASVLVLGSIWIPWPELAALFKRTVREQAEPGARVQRWLCRLTVINLAIWLYLEWFGPSLGRLPDGRILKLHAHPHLQFAYLFAALAPFRTYRRAPHDQRPPRPAFRQMGWILGGGILGFLPEIIHRIGMAQEHGLGLALRVGSPKVNVHNLAEVFSNLGSLPAMVRAIWVVAPAEGNPAPLGLLSLESLLSHFSVAWFALAISGLIWGALRKAGRAQRAPVWIAAALAVFVFVRFRAYSNSEPRYLFPVLPAMAVGLGWALMGIQTRWRVWGRWIVIGLGVTVFAHQSIARRVGAFELSPHTVEEARAIVGAFKEAEIRYVLSDEYWHSSHHLTFWSFHQVSREEQRAGDFVQFEPPPIPAVRDPGAETRVRLHASQGPIGLLRTVPGGLPGGIPQAEPPSQMVIWEMELNLRTLLRIPGRELYEAHRIRRAK